MKKIFTLLILLLSTFIFSQEFIMTNDNYKLKADNSKDYIVVEIPEKTKEELFIMSKKYLNFNYKGIKNDGYNEVENEQIIIDILSRDYRKIWINLQGGNLWKVSNRYEFNFKDGKLMIRPYFSHFSNTENNSIAKITVLYDSRGEVRKENIMSFVEALANNFIRNFKKGIEEYKSNDW